MASAGCAFARRVQTRGASQTVEGRKQAVAARATLPRPSVLSRVPARRFPVLAAALADVGEAVDTELDMKSLYAEFTELLDKYDHNFKRGDMITGTVFRTDERGAYVDIGAKTAGYCSSTECSLRSDVKVSGLFCYSQSFSCSSSSPHSTGTCDVFFFFSCALMPARGTEIPVTHDDLPSTRPVTV
jgi:hypothetical protein